MIDLINAAVDQKQTLHYISKSADLNLVESSSQISHILCVYNNVGIALI